MTLDEQVRLALAEDVGTGDATTLALVPPTAMVRAAIMPRAPSRMAGAEIARRVFQTVDPGLSVTVRIADGADAPANETVMTLAGRAASILTAERTALNFMQRLTGIATLTAAFVARAQPYGVTILDTRKTTPGWRALEKDAVRHGGGSNHRMGLYDRIMIKDNHRRFWAAGSARTLADAVRAARDRFPELIIEVEVESEDELADALAARPEWILLDNMTVACMRRCVRRANGQARLEASGGITLANIEAVAATGVDAVSLGCLTHSAPAADLSLEFDLT